eukprot:2474473-Pyramimonas_sp.AAC.1
MCCKHCGQKLGSRPQPLEDPGAPKTSDEMGKGTGKGKKGYKGGKGDLFGGKGTGNLSSALPPGPVPEIPQAKALELQRLAREAGDAVGAARYGALAQRAAPPPK